MKCNKTDEKEEILFSELFRQIAEEEGNRLLQEAEKLNNDPACALPPELEERCLRAAQRAEKQNRCRRRLHGMCRALTHAVVCLAVVVTSFLLSYITVSAFHEKVDRMILEFHSRYVGVSMAESTLTETFGRMIKPTWIPKGYSERILLEDEPHFVIEYFNASTPESIINYMTFAPEGMVQYDSEDADIIEQGYFMGFQSLYIAEEECIIFCWLDTERNLQCALMASGCDKETIMKMAESMYEK